MGIDLYDVMNGVGEALTIVGNERMAEKRENKKMALHEKLKQEEEARAEQRQIRREQREAEREKAKPVGEGRIITKEGGALYRQNVNAYGEPLDERPLDKFEIDQYQRQLRKEEVNIESILANTESARTNAEATRQRMQYEPQKFALESRLTEAQIDNYREPNSRAARDDKPVDDSLGSLTSMLVKEMSDLKEAYSEIDAATFRQIAQESIKNAAARGQDARVIFEDALRRYGKPRQKR